MLSCYVCRQKGRDVHPMITVHTSLDWLLRDVHKAGIWAEAKKSGTRSTSQVVGQREIKPSAGEWRETLGSQNSWIVGLPTWKIQSRQQIADIKRDWAETGGSMRTRGPFSTLMNLEYHYYVSVFCGLSVFPFSDHFAGSRVEFILIAVFRQDTLSSSRSVTCHHSPSSSTMHFYCHLLFLRTFSPRLLTIYLTVYYFLSNNTILILDHFNILVGWD